jgi:hypothetical protein
MFRLDTRGIERLPNQKPMHRKAESVASLGGADLSREENE